MRVSLFLGVVLALGLGSLLAACQPVSVKAPSQTPLAGEVVRLKGEGPPPSPQGECWASSVSPAVIETVSEQVLVSEELRDASGVVLQPATFRTRTQQRMVQDREEIWFRAPCPEAQTVQFIASLQRALKARGLYVVAVTGEMNPETAEAVRRDPGCTWPLPRSHKAMASRLRAMPDRARVPPTALRLEDVAAGWPIKGNKGVR